MPKSRHPAALDAPSGFTLIELLVTVTIIGILSTIALLAYSAFIKTSRDAKRESDLKIIQSAFEQYHADQHFYPPLVGASPIDFRDGKKITNKLGLSSPPPVPEKVYLNQSPVDPLNDEDHTYLYLQSCSESDTSKCTDYCLCTNMENTYSPELTPVDCRGWMTAIPLIDYCTSQP